MQLQSQDSISHTLQACKNTSYGRTVSTAKNDKNLSALHYVAESC